MGDNEITLRATLWTMFLRPYWHKPHISSSFPNPLNNVTARKIVRKHCLWSPQVREVKGSVSFLFGEQYINNNLPSLDALHTIPTVDVGWCLIWNSSSSTSRSRRNYKNRGTTSFHDGTPTKHNMCALDKQKSCSEITNIQRCSFARFSVLVT